MSLFVPVSNTPDHWTVLRKAEEKLTANPTGGKGGKGANTTGGKGKGKGGKGEGGKGKGKGGKGKPRGIHKSLNGRQSW